MLEQIGTWEKTDLPPGQQTIGTKWVFKRKWDGDGYGIYKASNDTYREQLQSSHLAAPALRSPLNCDWTTTALQLWVRQNTQVL